MGTSNSKMTNMTCKELEKTLEECCRKKNEDKIKGEAIPKEDPCALLKDAYIIKCDSKEDFKKQLINC